VKHGASVTYDDTEIQSKISEIESTIGTISNRLDAINGEVI